MSKEHEISITGEYNGFTEFEKVGPQPGIRKRNQALKKCYLRLLTFIVLIFIVGLFVLFAHSIARSPPLVLSRIVRFLHGTDSQSTLTPNNFVQPKINDPYMQDAPFEVVQTYDNVVRFRRDIGNSDSVKDPGIVDEIAGSTVQPKMNVATDVSFSAFATQEQANVANRTSILGVISDTAIDDEHKIAMSLANALNTGLEPPFELNRDYEVIGTSMKFRFLKAKPQRIPKSNGNYYYSIEFKGKPLLLASIKKPKNQLMELSSEPLYFINSKMTFEYISDAENNKKFNEMWLLIDGDTFPRFIRRNYSLKQISSFVGDLIQALTFIEDNGYFVDDPYALKFYESGVTKNGTVSKGLRLFDDGNFITQKPSREKYGNSPSLLAIQSLINRVSRDYFRSLTPSYDEFYEVDDGTLFVPDNADESFVDFYLIITGRTRNLVEKLSDLAKHPFIEESEVLDWDVFGERFPAYYDSHLWVDIYPGTPKEMIYGLERIPSISNAERFKDVSLNVAQPVVSSTAKSESANVTVPTTKLESANVTVPTTKPESASVTVPTAKSEPVNATVPTSKQEFVNVTVPTTEPESVNVTVPTSKSESANVTVPTAKPESASVTVPTTKLESANVTVPTSKQEFVNVTVPTTEPESANVTVPTAESESGSVTVPTTKQEFVNVTVPTTKLESVNVTVPTAESESVNATVPTTKLESANVTVPTTKLESANVTVPTSKQEFVNVTVPTAKSESVNVTVPTTKLESETPIVSATELTQLPTLKTSELGSGTKDAPICDISINKTSVDVVRVFKNSKIQRVYNGTRSASKRITGGPKLKDIEHINENVLDLHIDKDGTFNLSRSDIDKLKANGQDIGDIGGSSPVMQISEGNSDTNGLIVKTVTDSTVTTVTSSTARKERENSTNPVLPRRRNRNEMKLNSAEPDEPSSNEHQ